VRLTLKRVNAEIARQGGHARLVHCRAEEYFYFIDVGVCRVPSESICVSRLNVYTLAQWVEEWRIAEHKETA